MVRFIPSTSKTTNAKSRTGTVEDITINGTDGYGGGDDGYDYASPAVNMGAARMVGLQIAIDNTDLVGTLKIQCSNNGSTWVDIPLSKVDPDDSEVSIIVSSETVATGVDTSLFLSGADIPASFVRVYFDYTSGAGDISIWTRAPRGV